MLLMLSTVRWKQASILTPVSTMKLLWSTIHVWSVGCSALSYDWWRIPMWETLVIVLWSAVFGTGGSCSRRRSLWMLWWNTCSVWMFKLFRLELGELLLYQLLLLGRHGSHRGWTFSMVKLGLSWTLWLWRRRYLFQFFLVFRSLALTSSYLNHGSWNWGFASICHILSLLGVYEGCIVA